MPLLIDEDAKTVGTFDITTAQTLYWKSVPVALRQPDREEQIDQLTFRVLSGYTRPNHSLRVLRIHISSEDDPFFLHTLEVSEDDFQTLKAEQGILVDFSNFPGKIVTLLDKCLASQQPDAPRFQAVLTLKGGSDSVFKFVETNDFKQLPHITLNFRPGNDFAVKQFLAFRLQEVKDDCQQLSKELAGTKDNLASSRTQLEERGQRLALLREQYDKQLLEAQAAAKTQQATAHEERIREKGQLKEQLDRERAQVESRYREQVEALSARLAELDADNRNLREAKYQLDTQVSELSHKLGTAEGSKRSLDAELVRLQAAHKAASHEKHELEIQLNEAKAKLIALEEKAQAQAGMIEQQGLRLRDLEGAARQWESRCGELREVLAGHEQRAKEAAAEVLKGNQIIEKLSSDLRLSKEKAKRKQAIILRQEEELTVREQALAQAHRETATVRQEAEALQSELSLLKADSERLKSRLEESKQQLQSNEQMIRWLNQQVTEAQLSMTTTVPGSSRYTFRPSTMATPAAALLPAAGSASAYPSRFTTPGLGTAGSTLKTGSYRPASSFSPRAGPTPFTSKTNVVPTTVASAAGAAAGLASRVASPGKQAHSYTSV